MLRDTVQKLSAFHDAFGIKFKAAPLNGPVFVMGCGRSGTHWLGRILDSHPDITTSFEEAGTFDLVTRLVLRPSESSRTLPRLIKNYYRHTRSVAPKLYADKSHPTMWMAEELHRVFPNALFLGIERNPYATVASMIRHAGVTRWTVDWRKYEIPNRFLGISDDIAPRYDSLSLVEKHALRWTSHARRMRELRSSLDARMHLVVYESLHIDIDHELDKLQHFLGVSTPFPVPTTRSNSLDKWKEELREHEVQSIRDIVKAEGHADSSFNMSME